MKEHQIQHIKRHSSYTIIKKEYCLIFVSPGNTRIDGWPETEYRPAIAFLEDVHYNDAIDYKYIPFFIVIGSPMTEKESDLINTRNRHYHQNKRKEGKRLWRNLLARTRRAFTRPLIVNQLLAQKMKGK